MISIINYEESGFLKRAILVIKSDQVLEVVITEKRHIKLLRSELGIFNKSKQDMGFPSTKLFLFMLPFLTMYFYALSAGYNIDYDDDGSVLSFIYKK